jgi:hypothetical protein
MFHKSSAARLETATPVEAKTGSLWGFRRRKAQDDVTAAPVTSAKDADFTPDTATYGFESFGRSGLQLGGLHRDQQWVVAWGGRF